MLSRSQEENMTEAQRTQLIKDLTVMAHKANSHVAAVRFMNRVYRLQREAAVAKSRREA